MRRKSFITICLLWIFMSLSAQEKKIEVTGVVTDMNNEPLIGVNVTVKDQAGLGAITDINGRYKLILKVL
ncbi:Outer membrane receptor for ferrienterochelin and colicins [Bacteroides ovatus]|nr:Outer membrane receptor for ferrienterochelin and colicins [Bacteroides ovatus]